jgi:hypothetical protein
MTILGWTFTVVASSDYELMQAFAYPAHEFRLQLEQRFDVDRNHEPAPQ